MGASKRYGELSYMNVFLCFLVMFIHISGEPFGGYEIHSFQSIAVTFFWRLSSFAVPGFLFLSGLKLFLNLANDFSFGKYLLRRAKRVFIPYVCCVLVYYLFFVLCPAYGYVFSFADLAKYIAIGSLESHFYFIVILAGFTVLVHLWIVAVRRLHPAVLIFISLALTLLSAVTLPNMFPNFALFKYSDRIPTSYLVYFMLGCVCGKEYDRAKRFFFEKRMFFMIAFAAVVLLDPVCFVLCRVGILSLSYLTKEYIHIFFNIFSVLFCFTVASVYFGREPKEAIKLIDLASFEIYLWHLLLMHAVDFLMPGVFGISARYVLRAVCVMIGAPVICSLLVIIKGRLFKRKNT